MMMATWTGTIENAITYHRRRTDRWKRRKRPLQPGRLERE